MTKYLKHPVTIIGILSIIIFTVILFNNNYMDYKVHECIVLDKMTTPGSYRNAGNFYLVLKEEKGTVFDLIVAPRTFSQSKIGSIKYFNLRQFDIKQTPINNAIYFFGLMIFGAIGFTCLVFGLVLLTTN